MKTSPILNPPDKPHPKGRFGEAVYSYTHDNATSKKIVQSPVAPTGDDHFREGDVWIPNDPNDTDLYLHEHHWVEGVGWVDDRI